MFKIFKFLGILLLTTIPSMSILIMPSIFISFAMMYIVNFPAIDDKIWIALIVTVPAIINSVGTFLLHGKVTDNNTKIENVGAKVETVKQEINGQMMKLLEVTGQSEKAKGVLEGKVIEKAKQHDRDVIIEDKKNT
jgi:hypothetical protein